MQRMDQEPLPADDPLLKLDNVVLTPHSAGMTPETVEKGAEMQERQDISRVERHHLLKL